MAQIQDQDEYKAMSSQLEKNRMEYIVAMPTGERDAPRGRTRAHGADEQLEAHDEQRVGRSWGKGRAMHLHPLLSSIPLRQMLLPACPLPLRVLQPMTALHGYHFSEPPPSAAAVLQSSGCPQGPLWPAGSGGGAGSGDQHGAGAGNGAGGRGWAPPNGADDLPNQTPLNSPLRATPGGQVEVEALAELHRRPHLFHPSSSSSEDDSPGGRASKRSREKTSSERRKKKEEVQEWRSQANQGS